eukprot:2202367-Alexandrium_andersonii.AAC.1
MCIRDRTLSSRAAQATRGFWARAPASQASASLAPLRQARRPHISPNPPKLSLIHISEPTRLALI